MFALECYQHLRHHDMGVYIQLIHEIRWYGVHAFKKWDCISPPCYTQTNFPVPIREIDEKYTIRMKSCTRLIVKNRLLNDYLKMVQAQDSDASSIVLVYPSVNTQCASKLPSIIIHQHLAIINGVHPREMCVENMLRSFWGWHLVLIHVISQSRLIQVDSSCIFAGVFYFMTYLHHSGLALPLETGCCMWRDRMKSRHHENNARRDMGFCFWFSGKNLKSSDWWWSWVTEWFVGRVIDWKRVFGVIFRAKHRRYIYT